MKSAYDLLELVLLCINEKNLGNIVSLKYQEPNLFFPERFSCYGKNMSTPMFYTKGKYFMGQGIKIDYTLDENEDKILLIVEKILDEIKQIMV